MAKKKEHVIEDLAKVKFVGPALAETMYKELSIRSLDDLVQAAKAGKLQNLSGVGAKKEKSILRSASRYATSNNGATASVEPAQKAKAPATRAPKDAAKKTAAKKAPAKTTTPASKSTPTKVPTSEAEPAQKAKAPAARAPKEVARPTRSLQERFIATLRCPACGNDEFDVSPGVLVCKSCQRQFTFQNDIADLAPPQQPGRGMAQRLMELQFYAQFYEDVMRPRLTGVVSDRTLREEYRLAADFLELDGDIQLLDVACGTANFTRYFAQRLGLVEGSERELARDTQQPLLVGMDLSWPMLETARNYLRRESLEKQIFLVRGDALRMPVKRGAYNRLHCAGALHMMSDIDEALRNFARVLEPGGICVIGTFILGEGLLRRYVKRIAEIPTKFHWFSREELYRRLERAGFQIEDESIAGDAITVKMRRP